MTSIPVFVELNGYTPDPDTGEDVAIEIMVRAPSNIPTENVLRVIAESTGPDALAAVWNAYGGDDITAEQMAFHMARWGVARKVPISTHAIGDDD